MGLCGCRGVEEWFFERSRAYEQPSEEIKQQDALDEIMPKTELLTEVPTSILVAETMDTGEGRQGYSRLQRDVISCTSTTI